MHVNLACSFFCSSVHRCCVLSLEGMNSKTLLKAWWTQHQCDVNRAVWRVVACLPSAWGVRMPSLPFTCAELYICNSCFSQPSLLWPPPFGPLHNCSHPSASPERWSFSPHHHVTWLVSEALSRVWRGASVLSVSLLKPLGISALLHLRCWFDFHGTVQQLLACEEWLWQNNLCEASFLLFTRIAQ